MQNVKITHQKNRRDLIQLQETVQNQIARVMTKKHSQKVSTFKDKVSI